MGHKGTVPSVQEIHTPPVTSAKALEKGEERCLLQREHVVATEAGELTPAVLNTQRPCAACLRGSGSWAMGHLSTQVSLSWGGATHSQLCLG